MVVEYQNSEIKGICLETRKAVRLLGAESARKLKGRLSDLRAARNVTELIAGRPHPYKGHNERRFSLDLAGGARLLFVPTKDPPPRRQDGGIDWASVAEVTIVCIGDNHDG